jgi:hypothetical protein
MLNRKDLKISNHSIDVLHKILVEGRLPWKRISYYEFLNHELFKNERSPGKFGTIMNNKNSFLNFKFDEMIEFYKTNIKSPDNDISNFILMNNIQS